MYELKTYRGVMYHNNEKWCKTWREIDGSKIDMRNLTIFESSTQKCQNFLKKIYVWARKVRKSTENESLLVLSKHEELGKFSTVERFILDSKMAELNENENSKQWDRPMQWENFVLP